MEWQKLDKESLENLKQCDTYAIVYAPKWDTPPYDTIWWNDADWDSLMNTDNWQSPYYNNEELLSIFSHYCIIDQPKNESEKTHYSENWLDIRSIKPPEYDWILLGRWLNDECSMVWQIGRLMPKTGFEFWDSECSSGPYESDSFWDFKPDQTTHWMGISYSDAIEDEI